LGPATTRRRPARRDELIEAALARFAAKGVRATSVDDIVREAGAAKGTFYLYFPSRDAMVTAVAERLVEGIVGEMERTLRDDTRSAADRIRGIAAAMSIVTAGSVEADLVAEIHRPENAPIHDELGERIMRRLAPAVSDVIRGGIERGEFLEQDADRASAYVLASYAALDHLVSSPAELEVVSRELDAFVLRGLGCGVPR
jgi:AcrR family transcriptional regulator